jgi:hypothetical protein
VLRTRTGRASCVSRIQRRTCRCCTQPTRCGPATGCSVRPPRGSGSGDGKALTRAAPQRLTCDVG